jgi:GntR family transcriptional regulator, transcriptional repressor for pyruvate dehydrogenase complex
MTTKYSAMPGIGPRDIPGNLDCDILRAVRAQNRPIGSWTLHYVLREYGHDISAPTIGRKLRELEQRGMLSPATPEGRSLTSLGENLLKRAEEEKRIHRSTERLLLSLQRNSRKDLIDQLIARRAIESEVAGLAALNASSEAVGTLEGLIEAQRKSILIGEMGVAEDVKFHEGLAQVSGNLVLVSLVHLLRSHEWFNDVITAIRAKVGGRRVVDHEEIVGAVKQRDVLLAKKAIEQHITRLITDIDQYWEQVFGSSNSPAPILGRQDNSDALTLPHSPPTRSRVGSESENS